LTGRSPNVKLGNKIELYRYGTLEDGLMKLRGKVTWLMTMALVVLFVTACAKKVPAPPPPPPPEPPAAPAPPPPPPAPAPRPAAPAPAPAPPTEDELFARKTLDQLNAEMPLGDVAFDYDKSAIRDDMRAILQKNADWMRRWTTTRVSIEGHADQRGTNEYNLALGERRAKTVMDYLVSLGIGSDRLVTVSKGEEVPLCTELTEACYARNRRGHFVVTAK
jgi:peptidoglycan-associated lipoprotein